MKMTEPKISSLNHMVWSNLLMTDIRWIMFSRDRPSERIGAKGIDTWDMEESRVAVGSINLKNICLSYIFLSINCFTIIIRRKFII